MIKYMNGEIFEQEWKKGEYNEEFFKDCKGIVYDEQY